MKTFSVWRHGLRRYDYFQTQEVDHSTATGAPRHLRPAGHIGIPPSAAAWPLPADAKFMGHGVQPIGHIATNQTSALSGTPAITPAVKSILLIAVGAIAMRILRAD